jgi:hypothetical protein
MIIMTMIIIAQFCCCKSQL